MGAEIKGFGGTSSGPAPLIELHKNLKELYSSKIGEPISLCRYCRHRKSYWSLRRVRQRSSICGSGNGASMTIQRYLEMKNDQEKLYHHRWGSNNSFNAEVGMDYTWHAAQSQKNGEPGYIWLDNARTRGRFKDGPRYDDVNVAGFNPCVEQQLEDAELVLPGRNITQPKHDDYEGLFDALSRSRIFMERPLPISNTHWPETNAKMLKNRRIGLSQSGVVQAFNKFGRREVYEMCDKAHTRM